MNVQESVLQLLQKITGRNELHDYLDINLFEEALLDSLGLVELIVASSQEFGVAISPSEVDRNSWSTPRQIIANIEARLA
jgi:D-alanine--poly(phosphoribitol) ligase subunit 2